MASMPPQDPAMMQQPVDPNAPVTTGDEDSNVTPEEQAEYDEFMENAMRLMYDGENVRPEVVEALNAAKGGEKVEAGNGPPPPVFALANAARTIIMRIDNASQEAERPVSNDVLFHGGVAVIEELAEIAEVAGIYEYTEDEMAGATNVVVDMYRDKAMQDGRTDESQMLGEWDQLVAADKEGRADEVVPGIMEAGKRNSGG